MENRHFSGAIFHYLCIFNRVFEKQYGICIAIRSTDGARVDGGLRLEGIAQAAGALGINDLRERFVVYSAGVLQPAGGQVSAVSSFPDCR